MVVWVGLPSEGEIKAAAASDDDEALTARLIAARLLPASSAAFTAGARQAIIHQAQKLAASGPPLDPLRPRPSPSVLPPSLIFTATARLASSQLPVPDTTSLNSLLLLALRTTHAGLSAQGLSPQVLSSSYMKHFTGDLPVQSSSHANLFFRNLPVQSSSHTDVFTRNHPVQSSGHSGPFTRNVPVQSNSRADLFSRNLPVQSSGQAGRSARGIPVQPSSRTSLCTRKLPVESSGHTNLVSSNMRPLSYMDLLHGNSPLQLSLSDLSGFTPPILVTPSNCVDPDISCFSPEYELQKLQAAGPRLPSTYECKKCGRTFPLPQSVGGHMSKHKREERLKKINKRKAEAHARKAAESLCGLQKTSLSPEFSGGAEYPPDALSLRKKRSAVATVNPVAISLKGDQHQQPCLDAATQSLQQLLLDQQILQHQLIMLPPDCVLVPPASPLADPSSKQHENQFCFVSAPHQQQQESKIRSGATLVMVPPASPLVGLKAQHYEDEVHLNPVPYQQHEATDAYCVLAPGGVPRFVGVKRIAPERILPSAVQYQDKCSHGTMPNTLSGSRRLDLDLNSTPAVYDEP
ncbi:unnamed protein product [Closterium sp. Naga37s-1]|nr:unnamed protein product [Closterium sp. Naga37s-1]